jgi:hypothetical protein
MPGWQITLIVAAAGVLAAALACSPTANVPRGWPVILVYEGACDDLGRLTRAAMPSRPRSVSLILVHFDTITVWL